MKCFYALLLFFFCLPCVCLSEGEAEWIHVENLEEAPEDFYDFRTIKKIQQNEIVYSTGRERSPPLVATDSAGPCVILSARHRATGAGFLAHIQIYSEIDLAHASGRHVIRKLKKLIPKSGIQTSKDDVIDFYVFGGWPCCSSLILQSVNNFISVVGEKIKPIGKVYYKTQEPSLLGANLLVDMETGNFFRYTAYKDRYGRPLNIAKGV